MARVRRLGDGVDGRALPLAVRLSRRTIALARPTRGAIVAERLRRAPQ